MNTTMKWLLKREFWEHKGGFFWAPMVVGAILALGVLVSTVAGVAFKSQHGVTINGEQVTNISRQISAEDLAQMANAVSQGYVMTSAPLFLVMAVVVFFFSLGSLFDERKDRSVLFWKSLPVSDNETVASKVAMALVGAPLITLGFGIVTSLLVLVIAMAGASATGVSVAGAVFTSPSTYMAPFALLAQLPVYIVWALPTVGWLMMVSAWARTKVFLWAVGVPVLTGVLLAWFNAMFDFNWDVKWFWENIVARGLLSVLPGSWFAFVDPEGGIHMSPGRTVFLWPMVAQSWKTLASVHAVVGAVAGLGMLYAAARIRRWKDEG
jgi:ABC-2 type transport system permease protein